MIAIVILALVKEAANKNNLAGYDNLITFTRGSWKFIISQRGESSWYRWMLTTNLSAAACISIFPPQTAFLRIREVY